MAEKYLDNQCMAATFEDSGEKRPLGSDVVMNLVHWFIVLSI